MAKQANQAPAVAQTAPVVAAPAVAGFTPEMLAAIQQMLSQAAPKAVKATAPAAPTAVTGITVTVTQLGKSWSSKQGNAMIAVRGTLPNGQSVGGNLWIK